MLNSDFKELLELLNANEVRYLVVDGFAVTVHGYPRYTKDIDIWVEMDPENIIRLLKSIEEFGLGSLGLKPDDFSVEDQIVQLGYPPRRIDLFVSIPGVEFSECYKTRIYTEMNGISVAFINKANLIKNKRASGRHQDLADLENLEG